jgi:hypothetical protein
MILLKKYKHILFLLLALVFLVLVEYITPKPIDWRFTFSKDDKIPYGNYLLYNRLTDIFPNNKVQINTNSFYEAYHNHNVVNNNFIIITDNFDPSKLEIEEMLKLASAGNNFFISMSNYRSAFFDTLKCSQDLIFSAGFQAQGDSVFALRMAHLPFDTTQFYQFDLKTAISYFNFRDSATTSLAYFENISPVYIKIPYGKGHFYLHCNPVVFTNWHILKPKVSSYISNVFSCLPENNIIWDEYYKPYRNTKVSLFNVVLVNPSLRNAYLLLLFALIIYFIFESKRKQRIIPLIEPPRNSTLDFIKTVGRLYYANRNNHDIASKKWLYFADFVRRKYYIDISANRESLSSDLSLKSGVDESLIKEILTVAQELRQSQSIPDGFLLKFSSLIDNFHKQRK